MRILIAGASGFIGLRLATALQARGHDVRAMTREPDRYAGAGTPVGADVFDEAAVKEAAAGCDLAYYLVHSLDRADFEAEDTEGARSFARALASAGVSRTIYLGGLGDDGDHLSAHLRSRRSVEGLLAESGAGVTTLRAGIVVGHGGVSWEMTRAMVERLPLVLAPSAARTRTQPIAVADVVHYLVALVEHPETAGRHFDVGGADVLTYVEMLQRVAVIEGRHTLVRATPVPLLWPSLAAPALALLTGVDRRVTAALLGSMGNEVVVRDDAIRAVVPLEPMGYDDAVLAALGERAAEARA